MEIFGEDAEELIGFPFWLWQSVYVRISFSGLENDTIVSPSHLLATL
jgi:hypothetical protein